MKKKINFIVYATGAIVLVLVLIYIFRFVLPVHLSKKDIKTAIVDRGTVMRTIPAKGIVEPENEVLLRSAANSVIKKIVKVPGSHVKAGEVIVIIDQDPLLKDIEKLEDQIAVKKNNLRKNHLNARSIRIDLDYNVEMKKLKISSIKAELADQKQLLEVGGISPARHDQTKQELVIAEKDLDMLLEKNSIRLKQLDTEEEGLQLQIQIEEKELENKNEILREMSIRAPSSGIVLNTYGKEGEKVSAGQVLVMMSDLSSYKISGSVEEEYAEFIKTGRGVIVKLDRDTLHGKVGNIMPVIENSKVSFDVFLNENSHKKLIPNMKIDIQVVRARHDSVLRIQNGGAFDDSRNQMAFFIESNKAFRKEIVTGIKDDKFVEIVSGAKEGDELIISDVSAYRHNIEIDIND
jgi:HlyD family secretion protein